MKMSRPKLSIAMIIHSDILKNNENYTLILFQSKTSVGLSKIGVSFFWG